MRKTVRFYNSKGKCYFEHDCVHADISTWNTVIDFGKEGFFYNDHCLEYQELERIEYKLGVFKLTYVSGHVITISVQQC